MSARALIAELEGLANKYRELLKLRRQRDRLERRGVLRLAGRAAERRLSASRAVATLYPGSLRELDRLPATQVAGRWREVRGELRRVRRGGEVTSPWVRAMLEYHAMLREALAIKRWLAARRQLKPAVRLARFRIWYGRAAVRRQPVSSVDAHFLARYLRPAAGRVSEQVLRDLAVRLELTVAELRGLLLPDA